MTPGEEQARSTDEAGAGSVANSGPLRRRKCIAILALSVLAAFGVGLWGGFVWIDHVEIEQAGYRVSSWEDLGRLWILTLDQYLERETGQPASRGGYWRPLYALSISLDWALWGDWALGYRLENLLWHALVVAGVFLLGECLAGDRAIAFWAALFFAVHPLGVHSVTWISGRKDTMCAAFAIGALLAMLRACDRGLSRGSKASWSVGASVLLLLALLSKELALIAPAMATLLVLVPGVAAGGPHDGWRPRAILARLRPALLPLVPMWLVTLAVIAYRILGLGGFGLAAERPSDDALVNLAVSAELLTHYESLVLFPRVPSISDAWSIPARLGAGEIGAITLQLLLVGAAAIGLLKRRVWALGLAWFAIWILPASGVVPLRHVRAERYLYPASWGLIFAVVVLLAAPLGGRRVHARWPRALPALPALALAALTAYASAFWTSDRVLFTKTLEQDPRHLESLLGLASLAIEEGDPQRAIELSRRALEQAEAPALAVYWSPTVAYTNSGLALYQDGQHRAALEMFERALEHRPGSAIAHYHIGLARLSLNDAAGAAESFRRSLDIAPGDDLARANYGLALLRAGRAADAARELELVVERSPDDFSALVNLAAARIVLRQWERAGAVLERALELRPDLVQQAKLAWCRWELGERAEARRLIEEPARAVPDHPVVRFVVERMRRP